MECPLSVAVKHPRCDSEASLSIDISFQWAVRPSQPRKLAQDHVRCSAPHFLRAKNKSEFRETFLQKSPRRFELCESQRPLIGNSSLLEFPQSSQQVSPGGVREIVVLQVAAREDRVNEPQSGFWRISHRNGDRPVQFDHRTRSAA